MAGLKSATKTGFATLAQPLICACLKSFLNIPVEEAVGWLKKHFTDHSRALPKAIAAANDRAWQAVGLALAGDSLFEKIRGPFRDADMKAARDQIRAFVADADSGLESIGEGLRIRACDELNRLKGKGLLGANGVEFSSLDMTRFGDTSKTAEDAHRAVSWIAASLESDAPNLAQVLTLTPPGGGTPLLAAAFAFFLRRQIATNEELSRELTHDGLRWLTLKQRAGFENLERSLDSKWTELFETLGSWFADTDAELADIKAMCVQFLEQHQVSKKAESPLRVSVTSEGEWQRLKTLRDRLRDLPVELVNAELQSLLGDGLAAAGKFADAEKAHAAAADAAHVAADRLAEAESAYKQYKDACELRSWESALGALNRAIALDEKRFRPVPKHYRIDSILGAGAFGVVFKCRNTISFDEEGEELVLAVKTFREADLDRPLKELFGEANTLKNFSHENIIRVVEHGFADQNPLEQPYLAMEYFDGVTLESYLLTYGRLKLPDFMIIFRQIADALHAAHSGKRPIIHRDVKPANVMLRTENAAWQVKVIDFGLAIGSSLRNTSQDVPHSLRNTRDRSIAGTIKYAAPEQLGERSYPIGPHSDVFAFGKTALESLFGTTEPKTRHWETVPEKTRHGLKTLLERCTEEDLGEGLRLESFAKVVRAFNQQRTSQASPILQRAAVPTPMPTPTSKSPQSGAETRRAGEPFELALSDGIAMRFVWCPPGALIMGSELGEKLSGNYYRREMPVHEVELTKGFYAAISPVTRVQFARFVAETGHKTEAETQGGGVKCVDGKEVQDPALTWQSPGWLQSGEEPVTAVSWNDAQSFCVWLQKKTGQKLRLPTEAEWEYCCRAGTSTEYHFGDIAKADLLNFDGTFTWNGSAIGSNRQRTTPVGSFPANPWGLFDVHGNVWEWCEDGFDESYYQKSERIDPKGPERRRKYRICRGGSWANEPCDCRSACRLGNLPNERCNYLGFRVVFNLEYTNESARAVQTGPIKVKVKIASATKVGKRGNPLNTFYNLDRTASVPTRLRNFMAKTHPVAELLDEYTAVLVNGDTLTVEGSPVSWLYPAQS